MLSLPPCSGEKLVQAPRLHWVIPTGKGASLFLRAHTIESTVFFEKISYEHEAKWVRWVSRQFSVGICGYLGILWHLGAQRSQQALLGSTVSQHGIIESLPWCGLGFSLTQTNMVPPNQVCPAILCRH